MDFAACPPLSGIDNLDEIFSGLGADSPPLPPPAPHRPPPVPAEPRRLFVPYKYTFNASNNGFRICTRSSDGDARKSFYIKVSPWRYLEIPEAAKSDEAIESMCEILKSELAIDTVHYSEEAGAFTVEPQTPLTRRVIDVSQRIIDVNVETYSVLSRFGQSFYDPLHSDGQWATKEDLASQAIDIALATPFHTAILSGVDDKSFALVRRGFGPGDTTTVEIWTTHAAFSNKSYLEAAAESIASEARRYFSEDSRASHDEREPSPLHIKIRPFDTAQEIAEAAGKWIADEVDIAVHYGARDADTQLIDAVLREATGAEPDEKRLVEIFDVRDYVKAIYPDMPSHEFFSVASEVDLVNSDGGCAALTDSDRISAGASVVYLNRAADGPIDCGSASQSSVFHRTGSYIPNLLTNSHSSENITYCLERASSRAHLMGALYDSLKTSLFEFANLSGCNLSTLTRPAHASRGIVSFVNQATAHSQIVDTLPSDSMDTGPRPKTYVTPLSCLLIDKMKNSGHRLTEVIGRHIESARILNWVVREVYCMRDLAPAPLVLPADAYGVFRGMVYTISPIGEYPSARQWSSVLHVGLGSWIGVVITDSADPHDRESTDIRFGYYGLVDVCRHPFDAIRLAVEMYLSFKISNGTDTTPRAIATSVPLTADTMEMRQRITKDNVEAYESHLNPGELEDVRSGRVERTISLWYRSNGRLTTNSILADRRTYVTMIEESLTRTLTTLMLAMEREKADIAAAATIAADAREIDSEPPALPESEPPAERLCEAHVAQESHAADSNPPARTPAVREPAPRAASVACETFVRTVGHDRVFPSIRRLRE
jgi:hypothetical protein